MSQVTLLSPLNEAPTKARLATSGRPPPGSGRPEELVCSKPMQADEMPKGSLKPGDVLIAMPGHARDLH